MTEGHRSFSDAPPKPNDLYDIALPNPPLGKIKSGAANLTICPMAEAYNEKYCQKNEWRFFDDVRV